MEGLRGGAPHRSGTDASGGSVRDEHKSADADAHRRAGGYFEGITGGGSTVTHLSSYTHTFFSFFFSQAVSGFTSTTQKKKKEKIREKKAQLLFRQCKYVGSYILQNSLEPPKVSRYIQFFFFVYCFL